MTQFVDEMYLANLIRRNGTCFIGWYLILVYKPTLGLAVFYLWGGVGARHFASLATQMDQLSGLTRKNRLTCLVFRHSIIFSTSYSFLLLDFRLDVKYYEAVRNLRGKLLFVRHIGFSVVKKKAAYHSAGSNARDFWPWDLWSWFWVVLFR